MIGIYSIGLGDSVYVGKSQNISERWNEHRKLLARGTHHNYNLQLLYSSCSLLEYKILETCDSIHELSQKENFWIEKIGTLNIAGTSSGIPKLDKQVEDRLLLLAAEYVNNKQSRVPELCIKYSVPEKTVFNIKCGYSYFYLKEEYSTIRDFIAEPTRYNSNKTAKSIENVSEALLELSTFTKEVTEVEKLYGVHNLRSVVRSKRFLECEIPDILLDGISFMGKYYNVCSPKNTESVKSIVHSVKTLGQGFTSAGRAGGVSKTTASKIFYRELPKWQWLYCLMPELWE